MLDAESTLSIWAILLAIVAFGIWSERTVLGRKLTATVVILLTALFLSNINIIPSDAPVYGIVMGNFIPLGLALLLFSVDLRSLRREAGPTLLIFAIGAFGTIIGSVIAFHLISPAQYPAELAGMFAATYIGGSSNFAAIADAFALTDSSILVPALAADTLVTIAYLFILGTVPQIYAFFKKDQTNGSSETTNAHHSLPSALQNINLLSVILSLAGAFTIVVLGNYIQSLTEIKGVAILVITLLSLIAGTVFREQIKARQEPFQLGLILLMIFFAALGASGDVAALTERGPELLIFAATIMSVHFIITFGAGFLFKFDIGEITTASNACVCGPPTAAAMAANAGWNHLVAPGVVVGSLGFAIANLAGVLVVNFLAH